MTDEERGKSIEELIVIDSHLDLALNALPLGRDLTKSAHELRHLETSSPAEKGEAKRKGWGRGTVAFPDLRKGDVALSFATLLARVGIQSDSDLDFGAPANAYAAAHGQLSYYRKMEERGILRFITDLDELKDHLESWEEDKEKTPLGIVLSMEGSDPITEPAEVEEWWKKGLRVASLVHYGIGRYAHGTGTEGGLLPAGEDLLEAFEEVGMILDLTHLSEESFWEALEAFSGPVMASHNNCRELVPGDRQFSDEQLEALAERGGVTGVTCDNWMLYPSLREGKRQPEAVPLTRVADQIDYVCQLTGNADHVAIGSDLDGGFGADQTPKEIDTIADLGLILEELADRGYEGDDLAKIAYGNWLRTLKEAWQ